MHKTKLILTAAALSLAATGAYADNWTLDPSNSKVTFGSIKSEYFGENHTFSDISGTVSEAGDVELTIGLASVETMIDIRNERLIEHVFGDAANATVTAELDMEALNALEVGQTTTVDTFGTVSLLGNDVPLDASFFVMRVDEAHVLVMSDGMAFLSTEDAGINAGIDILQELAGLDSITRVSPVTMRLMFTSDEAMEM